MNIELKEMFKDNIQYLTRSQNSSICFFLVFISSFYIYQGVTARINKEFSCKGQLGEHQIFRNSASSLQIMADAGKQARSDPNSEAHLKRL